MATRGAWLARGNVFLAAGGIGLVLLALSGWLTYQSADRLIKANQGHTRSVILIAQIHRIEADFGEAALARRGFLLTGEGPFRQAYNHAHRQVRLLLEQVQVMVQDHPEQQARLKALGQILSDYDALVSKMFLLGPGKHGSASLAVGEALRQRFLAQLEEMVQEETQWLQAADAALEQRTRLTFNLIVGANLLAFSLVLLTAWGLRREVGRRGVLEGQLEMANASLGQRLNLGTTELAQTNQRLRQKVQEKLLAENLLRESEERYRQLVELCPDVIFIHQDFNFLFINTAGQKLFGVEQENLTGRNFLNFIHPQFHSLVRERYQHMIATGSALPYAEMKILRADGTAVEVESTGVPIQDRVGQAILVVMRDISELKKSMNHVREQASLLDKVQDAILVKDSQGRLRFWSRGAEELYGWKAAEVLGRPSQDILYSGPSPERHLALAQVRENGAWTGELTNQARDGRKITVLSRWSLLRDGEEGNGGIVIVNTDITEQKALEARFLRSQRLESIGTLAGGIAHDLNNLLTPILMAVRLLRKGRPAQEQQDLLDTAEASVRRGGEMVRQLLSFAGGMGGQRVALDITRIIKEVTSLLTHTLPKSIQVQVVLAPDLWQVQGDATQLAQVLMNLCVNARDAMPEGGTLTVRAQNLEAGAHKVPAGEPPCVLVTVEDTGSGIPVPLLTQIFDPFFTTKEQGKGTGLGLSTALGIVQAHGGTINVVSEEGKGTVFTVSLPTPSAAPERLPPAAAGEVPMGGGESILIVDDETFIRQTVKAVLEGAGYHVLPAANGQEALDFFQSPENGIQAVLLDMMMPGLDGQAVLKRLLGARPDLRVIAVSGVRAAGRDQEILSLGARAFLHKPFSDDQLLRTLAEVLRS